LLGIIFDRWDKRGSVVKYKRVNLVSSDTKTTQDLLIKAVITTHVKHKTFCMK